MKKKQNKTELATTNAKLYEDSKIAELYVKKTAPLIDKIIMKKRNPIPIVHCAILGQVHDEELSNFHTIENEIARTVAFDLLPSSSWRYSLMSVTFRFYYLLTIINSILINS